MSVYCWADVVKQAAGLTRPFTDGSYTEPESLGLPPGLGAPSRAYAPTLRVGRGGEQRLGAPVLFPQAASHGASWDFCVCGGQWSPRAGSLTDVAQHSWGAAPRLGIKKACAPCPLLSSRI